MERKICLFLALATAIMAILTSGAAQEGKKSVHFVESSLFNFFMAPNMTFDVGSAAVTLPGLNKCSCRSACVLHGELCKAWALTHLGDGSTQCRIAPDGPLTIVPYKNENSTYFFKLTSVPGTYEWPGDNHVYVKLDGNFTSQEAKRRCSMIPGHRLVIAKTLATFEYLISLWPKHKDDTYRLWIVDLIKKNLTEFVWGDGTPHRESPVPIFHNNQMDCPLFAIIYSNIDDLNESQGPFRVLCQANPLGINW